MAATEAQKRASNKWGKENKEQKKRMSYKSHSRMFIQKFANLDEIDELLKLAIKRKEELLYLAEYKISETLMNQDIINNFIIENKNIYNDKEIELLKKVDFKEWVLARKQIYPVFGKTGSEYYDLFHIAKYLLEK